MRSAKRTVVVGPRTAADQRLAIRSPARRRLTSGRGDPTLVPGERSSTTNEFTSPARDAQPVRPKGDRRKLRRLIRLAQEGSSAVTPEVIGVLRLVAAERLAVDDELREQIDELLVRRAGSTT